MELLTVSLFFFFQAYIKIYQGEELPHPKSMLQVNLLIRKYDVLEHTCH
jgi:hypothetical protein